LKKPVVLRIYKNEQLLGVKQFLDAQIVFGQPGDVQVALEGASVSLLHASLEEREDGYYISDLGSENGTFLNGVQVLDNKVESGDSIKIGDYKVEFFIGPPKPKVSSELSGVFQVSPPKEVEPVAKQDATPPVTKTASPSEPPKPIAPPVAPPVSVPPVVPPPIIVASTGASKPVVKPITLPSPPPTPPPVMVKPPTQEVAKPSPEAVKPTPVAVKPIAEAAKPASVPQVPPPLPPPLPPSPPQQAKTPVKEPVKEPAKQPEKQAEKQPEKQTDKQKPIVVPPPAAPSQSAGLGMSSGGSAPPSGSISGSISGSNFNANLVGPRARGNAIRKGESQSNHKKRKTFAPPSRYGDVKEFVKPSKGTVVEVLVAWRERVIANHHFSQPKTITIGSHPDNDIIVPVLSARLRKLPILKIEKQATVLVTAEMQGELLKGQTSSSFAELMRQNRLQNLGNIGYGINLDQGEMVKIELGDQISVIIRYVSDSPKPLMAPMFDLTASETTGIVLALAMVATLWLYMFIYQAPKVLPGADDLEPLRTAQIILTPPTPPPALPPPPVATPEATPVPTPPPVATPQKVKVQVSNKTQQAVKKSAQSLNLTTKNNPGKSANAAPNKNKTGPRQLTSPKQGGAIKTAPKEGAQMQSKSRDVSKSGVFSAFGNNGQQDQLAQSTTGAGELAGMANAATGKAGSAVDRSGKGLGSELKDTGVGGTGKAFEGIAGGVGTQGRGSGNTGYGTGGLGNKAGVRINTTGEGADIPGTIDREAIRRVIRQNLPTIRACYERQLNRKPDLFGKIVITWEIGEQGRVVTASVKSNELGGAEGKAVGECLVERLKTWRFPEPPKNMQPEISYPFLFSN
jgi:hypothetical protein